MRTIIIDDESRARKSISALLRYSPHKIQLVAEAGSVEEGVIAINKYKPELVLLDINMPDGTGFDLLKKLSKIDFKIIFITAFEEYAIQAFQFSAIDYILKPIDPKKLMDALHKAHQISEQESIHLRLSTLFANLDRADDKSKKLALKTNENIYVVNTNDIIRCESDGSYTKFFCIEGKTIFVSHNIKHYEEILSLYGFYRIHQSHLINMKYIDHYSKADGGDLIMKDGTSIPVSRRKKDSFLKLLDML